MSVIGRLRAFVVEEDEGQAALLILNLLVPMVLAVGFLMRVDNSIVLKIRVQNAADAATLEVGALTARVLNNIALHNQSMVKQKGLLAALERASKGAEKALQEAKTWKQKADQRKQQWDQDMQQAQAGLSDDMNPLGGNGQYGQKYDNQKYIDYAQNCSQEVDKISKLWQKIVNFWQSEKDWIDQQKGKVQNDLGGLVDQMTQKSDTMIGGMKKEIGEIFDRIKKIHRVEELYVANPSSLVQYPGDPTQNFDLNRDLQSGTSRVKDYQDIAWKGEDGSGDTFKDKLAKGYKHFEGTPPDKITTMANEEDKKAAPEKDNNGNWGSTRYYHEFLMNVHFGAPGYFNFSGQKMHGPLGNPDTKNPSCGGDQHKGCDSSRGSCGQNKPGQFLVVPPESGDVKWCFEDNEDYTRMTALKESGGQGTDDPQLKQESDSKVQEAADKLKCLKDNPELEWFIGGKVRANQGFFAAILPAHTTEEPFSQIAVQGLPNGKANYPKQRLTALSKFRLYNLSETEGEILEDSEFNRYQKTLMCQDWNALLVPLTQAEIDAAGFNEFNKKGFRH